MKSNDVDKCLPLKRFCYSRFDEHWLNFALQFSVCKKFELIEFNFPTIVKILNSKELFNILIKGLSELQR